MTLEKVLMQQTADVSMRLYNVRYELTEKAAEDGCRGAVDDLGEFGKLIMRIRGIEVIRVQPYRMFVSKAAMFLWEDIEPEVISLLTSFDASQGLLVADYAEYIVKN